MYNTFIDGSPPESEDEQQHQQTRVQARQRTRTLPKAGNPAPQRPYVKFPAAFLIVVAVVVWIGFLGGDHLISGLLTSATTTTIVYQTATALPGHESKPLPTLAPYVPLAPIAAPASGTGDVSLPVPATNGIAGNEATSQAMYQATVTAVAQPTPIPSNGQMEVPAQQLPPDTQAPPAPAAVNDPPAVVPHVVVIPVTTPINIQATHTCYHGQVWVDGIGCQWPAGMGDNKRGTKSTP